MHAESESAWNCHTSTRTHEKDENWACLQIGNVTCTFYPQALASNRAEAQTPKSSYQGRRELQTKASPSSSQQSILLSCRVSLGGGPAGKHKSNLVDKVPH